MNYTIIIHHNNNNNNNNNNNAIISNHGWLQILILLFEIPTGRRKNFLEFSTFSCKRPRPLLWAGKISEVVYLTA